MAVTPQQLPEWEQEETTYKGALTAAKKSDNPDLEVLKVENAWLKKQQELSEMANSRNLQEAQRNETIAKIKAEFPAVPEAAFTAYNTPDEMVNAAKAVAEAMQVTAPTQAQGQPQGWGTQAGGTQPPAASQYVDEYSDPKFLKEQDRLIRRLPGTADGIQAGRNLRSEIFRKGILPQIFNTKARATGGKMMDQKYFNTEGAPSD